MVVIIFVRSQTPKQSVHTKFTSQKCQHARRGPAGAAHRAVTPTDNGGALNARAERLSSLATLRDWTPFTEKGELNYVKYLCLASLALFMKRRLLLRRESIISAGGAGRVWATPQIPKRRGGLQPSGTLSWWLGCSFLGVRAKAYFVRFFDFVGIVGAATVPR